MQGNPDKFKGKYRIPTTRLPSWNYGSNAAYFITICTKDRGHFFGQIIDGKMNLSHLGTTAWNCWRAIPEHFPFVVLDEFVAMPNHVHGILIIDKPDTNATAEIVETQDFASLQRAHNKFGPQAQNLAAIIRGFKIGVTKFANQNNIPFEWQPRYYEHVVRNLAQHERIRKYIDENPQHWLTDDLYEA